MVDMEFFDVVKNRHSIRAFKDKKVEEEKLQRILESANAAPSAGNLQAYEIIVAKEQKKKADLAGAAFSQEFIAEAPVVLVFLASPKKSSEKYGKRGSGLYSIQDATIACAYAQLAATALGLGSVWVGAFDPEEVATVVNAKEEIPVAILPIGYSDEKPYCTSRRKDIIHKESLR
jgi:nitroreductase